MVARVNELEIVGGSAALYIARFPASIQLATTPTPPSFKPTI